MEEEIVTNPLTLEQLEESIPPITDILMTLGTPINVEYGWGCNLPTDQLWQTIQMDLSHLREFIEMSRKNRILDLGASDLHVSDLDRRWNFKLCHESDLHFVSSNRQILEDVATMWDRMGFAVKISLYTAVQAPREWRNFTLRNQQPPESQ